MSDTHERERERNHYFWENIHGKYTDEMNKSKIGLNKYQIEYETMEIMLLKLPNFLVCIQ